MVLLYGYLRLADSDRMTAFSPDRKLRFGSLAAAMAAALCDAVIRILMENEKHSFCTYKHLSP